MEVQRATKNFSEAHKLGEGGYGTVYRGFGPQGEKWAVKRAKTISLKGLKVFQTEVLFSFISMFFNGYVSHFL